MRFSAFLILVFFSLPILAKVGPAASEWGVAGGEIQISINQGAIKPFGLEIEAVNALSEKAAETPLMYRDMSFEGLTIQSIRLRAPNQSIEAFTGGYLHYHGGMILKIDGRTLD